MESLHANYLISTDHQFHGVAEKEEDNHHDQGHACLGVPLFLDPQTGAVVPDGFEPPPDEHIEGSQCCHGDEHGDKEGANHVVT